MFHHNALGKRPLSTQEPLQTWNKKHSFVELYKSPFFAKNRFVILRNFNWTSMSKLREPLRLPRIKSTRV